MSSVFVIISETMPVNGTYPASGIESVWATEDAAIGELYYQASLEGGPAEIESLDQLLIGDTTYYAKHDPEKFEYIEYRIEEHVIQTGA